MNLMANLGLHGFLSKTAAPASATALPGTDGYEFTALTSMTPFNRTANIAESTHLDGDGYAVKTATTANVDNITIEFDRKEGTVTSTDLDEDLYNVLANWFDNSRNTSMYLLQIRPRKLGTTNYYEGEYAEVKIAGVSLGEPDTEGVQTVTVEFAVSGGVKKAAITESSGVFSWAKVPA